jgi:TIR domain
MANIFISYRSGDFAEVAKLKDCLAFYGHDVWLGIEKIDIGDSIIERIKAGLEGAAFLVLCLSGHDLSPWMNQEWISILTRQLNGVDVKILPVKLAGRRSPAILAGIRYADLADDWGSGVQQLKAALA